MSLFIPVLFKRRNRIAFCKSISDEIMEAVNDNNHLFTESTFPIAKSEKGNSRVLIVLVITFDDKDKRTLSFFLFSHSFVLFSFFLFPIFSFLVSELIFSSFFFRFLFSHVFFQH